MTDEELNRFIHEEVMGKKNIHGIKYTGVGEYECPCGFNLYEDDYDASDRYEMDEEIKKHSLPNYLEHGKPWGELIEWAMKQEWWSKFEYNYIFNLTRIRNMDTYVSLNIDLFANPRSLAEHIAEYLNNKDGMAEK